MNWLRLRLRMWLGIDHGFSEIIADMNTLHAEVLRVQKSLNEPIEKATSRNSAKPFKPYRTASEVRNKLERESEEKA